MNVGIIGGADGPTSIYVSSSINWIWIVAAAVLVTAAVLFIVIKKCKK